MTRHRAGRLALVAGILLAAGWLSVGSAAAQTSGGAVTIELDRYSVAADAGDLFQFTSTITNEGAQPLTDVIANLNVVSADGDVYVDPEDWSSERSQYLARLDPATPTELTWNVRAVTSGDLILYVVVTTPSASEPIDASAPLHATITAIKTINASGVLPVAIGVPAVITVLLVLAQRRRRQHI